MTTHRTRIPAPNPAPRKRLATPDVLIMVCVGIALALLFHLLNACTPAQLQADADDVANARDAACALVFSVDVETPAVETARAVCASTAPLADVLTAVAACVQPR